MKPPHYSLQDVKFALDCPRQFVLMKKEHIEYDQDDNLTLSIILHNIVADFAKNAIGSKKFQESLETDSIEAIKHTFHCGLSEVFQHFYIKTPNLSLSHEIIIKLGDALTLLANDLSLRFIKLDTEKNPLKTLKKLFLGINVNFNQIFDIDKNNHPLQIEIEGNIDWISTNPEDNSLNIINFKLSSIENIEKDLNQIVLYSLVLDEMFHLPVSTSMMYTEGRDIILKNIHFEIIDKFKDKVLNKILLINNWNQLEELTSEVPCAPYSVSCKNCPIIKTCLITFGSNTNLEILGFDLSNSVDKENQSTENKQNIQRNSISLEPDKEIIEELVFQISKIRSKETILEEEPESSKKGKPEQVLEIGTRVNTQIPVTIKPLALLKHMVTLGATGSGKTVLGKIIIEEALRKNIPCILIDPQGDLCSLALPDDELGIQLRKKMQLKILTPNSSKGTPFSINLLKAPLRELLVDDDYFRTILDSTAKLLLDIAGYTKKKITAEKVLIEAILKEDWNNGISHTMLSLAERVDNTTTIFSVQDNAAISTEALLTNTKKKDLSKNIMKLAVGTDSAFFTGSYGFDIKDMLRKPALNIINLSSVGTDPNKRQLVVSWILRLIYDWLLRNPQKNQDNLRFLLYIDEVAEFMPPHPNSPPSKQMLMLLMRQARKYGCGMMIATQSPATIDYKAIDNVGTIMIGKITTKQSLTKIETFLEPYGLQAKGLLEEVQKVNTGEFVMIGGGNSKPLLLKTRRLHTKHQTLSLDEIELIKRNYDGFGQ